MAGKAWRAEFDKDCAEVVSLTKTAFQNSGARGSIDYDCRLLDSGIKGDDRERSFCHAVSIIAQLEGQTEPHSEATKKAVTATKSLITKWQLGTIYQ